MRYVSKDQRDIEFNHNYLLMPRFKEAHRLLENENCSVAEALILAGFRSDSDWLNAVEFLCDILNLRGEDREKHLFDQNRQMSRKQRVELLSRAISDLEAKGDA